MFSWKKFKDFLTSTDDNNASQSRVWPQWYVDQNESLSPEELLRQKFIYTRAFKLENDKDLARYNKDTYLYAAIVPSRRGNGDTWDTYCFSYSDNSEAPKEHELWSNEDRLEALRNLVKFERSMLADGNRPFEGSTSNLQHFATSINRHISKENRLVHVDGNALLTDAVEMKLSATSAFYMAAGTKAPTSTWEWFYERYIDSMEQRFPGAGNALQQEKKYSSVVDRSIKLIKVSQKVKQTPQSGDDFIKKIKLLRDAFQTYNDQKDNSVHDVQAQKLLAYACDMTLVVSFLRIGTIIISALDDFNNDGTINQHKIHVLKATNAGLHHLLETQFDMQPEERKAICDVMLRDDDPRGGITPLEVLFAAYPPPAPQPKPPENGGSGRGRGTIIKH